jgi:hypothetical protein
LKRRKRSNFKAGMYLLENLTTGMYNDPLSIYREYIQNSVDSVDIALRLGLRRISNINIALDPIKKNVTFIDNGTGLPSSTAEEVLSSIGSSNKYEAGLRGFRGIGRLGGIAFCDKAIFRTKAAGEAIESIQEWDCISLRRMLNSNDRTVTINNLFDSVTSFSQINGRPLNSSYFEVTLCNVSSFRNHIFDIDKIKNYLSQVAPVPFDKDSFAYTQDIENRLRKYVTYYSTFNISINDMPIFKPYKNHVKTSQKKSTGADEIVDIKYIDIMLGDDCAAYGWIGLRRDLLGSIRKGEPYAGVRVRVGNILIGGSHLLDKCFREDRFNSYLIGEIHINSPQLKPNSRRDDFIDGDEKTSFYNSVEKEIGLPFSKEIRERSRISSLNASNQPDQLANRNTQQLSVFKELLKSKCRVCPQYTSLLSELRGLY